MSDENLLLSDEATLLLEDDALFVKPKKKFKVVTLSDHPLAPSGVGVQARFLIEGLIKTGNWSFRCLGGAMKHENYETIAVNEDFVIKPVDGFGNKESLRHILLTERPDAILLFTDPRQFHWVWEMEDEIHQICPIVYWHVWDNDPYPQYNFPWYESTDLINCLSHKTYELLESRFPNKTHYVPHSFPKQVYFPLTEADCERVSRENFGDRKDWFKALWVNRNATRKMPADLLFGWKTFLDDLEKKHGHRNALLIMHTDPHDVEGPDLVANSDLLNLSNNVWFSTERLDFEKMNILHNITDTCINISKNEGFGLSTLISMQCGKPIVALKTGGLTRQVIDHRNGNELGAAIEPVKRSLVGSQMVPYIFEDFCTEKQISDAMMKVYELTPDEKTDLKVKIADYLKAEFNFEDMIAKWNDTMLDTVLKFKEKKHKKWKLLSVSPVPIQQPVQPVAVAEPVRDAQDIRGKLKVTKMERRPQNASKKKKKGK